MPVHHEIDHEKKLLITTCSGISSDSEFSEALINYYREIMSNRDYELYNEVIDLSQIDKFNLTTHGIIELSKIARSNDRSDIQSRLAIIAASPTAFGLSKMYTTYRNMEPNLHKEMQVFKSKEEAFIWLSEPAIHLNT